MPLLSSKPFLAPAVENDWHGGPPITTSASPFFKPDFFKISEDLIAEVKETCEGLTYEHAWQKDDFILADNIRFMHGRRFFEKEDPRQILIIEIERASFGYGSTTRTQIKS